CAGLGAKIAGQWAGLRSGGAAPGAGFTTGRGLTVKVIEWREEAWRRAPARWTGRLRLGKGVVEYQARATTPAAPVFPSGGFLGFAFDGEWKLRRTAQPIRGQGFCEYRADPLAYGGTKENVMAS